MRNLRDIQRAHDLLSSVAADDIPSLDSDTSELEEMITQIAIHAAADVLCWVLEHDHNPAFADNLVVLEKYARDCGLELVKAPPPN